MLSTEQTWCENLITGTISPSSVSTAFYTYLYSTAIAQYDSSYPQTPLASSRDGKLPGGREYVPHPCIHRPIQHLQEEVLKNHVLDTWS